MATELKTRIILRNDITANWEAVKDTLVLLKGELAVEFDPAATDAARRRIKIGDGVTTWANLPYFGESAEQEFAKVYQVPVAKDAEHIAAIAEVVGSAVKHSGDIAIVQELINEADESKGLVEHRQYTAYVYDGTAWKAMDGNYNAENVYFAEDLTYTSAIGVLEAPTKAEGSKKLAAAGKNVKQVLSSIMAKEENPSATQPSLKINSSNIGAKEAGTKIKVAYSTEFSAGSYTYGPATGITADDYNITFNGETLTTATGEFAEVQVTDSTNLEITGTFDHTQGAMPITNLGNNYEAARIAAQDNKAAVEKGTLTGYRNMFFGTVTAKGKITSAVVRALASKQAKASVTDKSIDIPVGAMCVIFAVPADKSVISVKDSNGLNAQIFSSFRSTTLNVEGAEGYDAIEYNVYCLDYANANDKANKYLVTVA